MGVPRFAAWLKRKFPGICAKRERGGGIGENRHQKKSQQQNPNEPPNAKIPDRVAAAYVDVNGIIHPACHSEDDPRVAAAPRSVKIQRVLEAIDNLVKRLQPEQLLFLAMDGVAPRAKMNQQRSRRYMAAVAKHGVVKDGGFAPDEEDASSSTSASAASGGGSTKEQEGEEEEDKEALDAAIVNDTKRPEDLAAVLDLGIYGVGTTSAASEMLNNNNNNNNNSPGVKSNSSEMSKDPFMSMDSTPQSTVKSKSGEGGEGEDDDNYVAPANFPSTPPPPAPPFALPSSSSQQQQQEQEKEKYDENMFGGFDSNCISPGTDFMTVLTAAMKEFVTEKLRSGDWSPNLSVIVSGSDEPGEGEHKLIDFMRRFSASPGWPRGAHVIHGLDADLILLCLTLHIGQVFILRDNDRRVTHVSDASASSPSTTVASATSTAAATTNKKKRTRSSSSGKKKEEDDNGEEDEEDDEDDDVEEEDDDDDDDEEEEGTMVRSPSRSPVVGPLNLTPHKPNKKYQQQHRHNNNNNNNSSKHPIDHNFLSAETLPPAFPAVSPVLAPVNSATAAASSSSSSHSHNNDNNNKQNNAYHHHHEEEEGEKKPTLSSQQEIFDIYLVAEYLVAEVASLAVSIHGPEIYRNAIHGNGRHIINDFVFLASILGNDFLPRLPSAFAGEASMDNVIEIYVRRVLGRGFFITLPQSPASSSSSSNSSSSSSSKPNNNNNSNKKNQQQKQDQLPILPCPDINLHALSAWFEGFAEVESALFRRFSVSVGKYLPDDMSSAPGPGFHSAVDSVWAEKYAKSTTCTPESTEKACQKYLEGMRFVFEYYAKTSSSCSWRWFYPFHHGPFAHDVSRYLKSLIAKQEVPPMPPMETSAPSPFVQLLCILPPSSLGLLPPALRPLLLHPPEKLSESFPHNWFVDFTCAEGQEHLSTIMIPFADLESISEHVKKVSAESSASSSSSSNNNNKQPVVLSESERQRGTNQRELSFIAVHQDNKTIVRMMSPPPSSSSSSENEQSSSSGGLKVTNVMKLKLEGDTNPKNKVICVPFAVPDNSNNNNNNTSSSKKGGGSSGGEGAHQHGALGLVKVPHLPLLPNQWNKVAKPSSGSGSSSSSSSSGRRNRGSGVIPVSMSLALPHFGTHLGEVLLFATLALGASVLFATGFSLTSLVKVLALVLPLVWLVFALWLPPPTPTYRNLVEKTYMDWLCPECGSLSFSHLIQCHRCGAPYNEQLCARVFAGKLPKTPPVLSVDHNPHKAECILKIDRKFYEAVDN